MRALKWLAGAFGVAAAALVLVSIFSGVLPLTARCTLTACEEGRAWLQAIVTGGVFVAGLFQYLRSQKWERAKFLAAEMKAFYGNAKVQNALTMVDWAGRYINLAGNADSTQWPLIMRRIQTFALLPHTAVAPGEGEEVQRPAARGLQDSELATFTANEAAIRDCFDALLDGLEQFSSYVESGLVSAKDLAPYIDYWIKDIGKVTGIEEDDEWTSALFCYIDFYGYRGVQSLFKEYGYDIAAGSQLFETFLKSMTAVNRDMLRKVVEGERNGELAPT